MTGCSLLFISVAAHGMRPLPLHFLDVCVLSVVQSIALLPGLSRLAFTCAAGCFLGFPLATAWSLSWLMYIPLMAAAVTKSMLWLYQQKGNVQLLNLPMVLVMLSSGIISLVIVQSLTWFIQSSLFLIFGLYMLAPLSVWLLLRNWPTRIHSNGSKKEG